MELGALEAMAVQGAQETVAVQGAHEAMAGGPCGRGLSPLSPAPTGHRNTRHRNTGQPSGARHTGQDSPPGTGSPPGLARKLRLLLGMTRSQGLSQGPSATASTSTTRGQEPPAPDESPWTRPTRYIKTVPEGKTRLKNHDSGDMARHSWP